MRQTWRWFGEHDAVGLSDIRQAGADGVVTALHHVPPGHAWTAQEIGLRQSQIARGSNGALTWDVVESLPVSEAIKTKSRNCSAHTQSYLASMEALADAGIATICYNFMPILDWTRTHLRWRLPNGGTAMRFDLSSFVAFDCFILERHGAADDYDADNLAVARQVMAEMTDPEKLALQQAVTAGLPGAAESWTLDELREALHSYSQLSSEVLRQNHIDFLSEVVPTAERLGLRLCCHPDDPPFSLLGLPRTMSSGDDYAAVLDVVDSPSAGMTFCSGSLGASPDNDCAEIARHFGPKIHFAHLRNVTCEDETIPCSFFEDEHLAGQVDMVGVIDALLCEEKRRRDVGREDAVIPMRPDHGQEILSDLSVDGQPGYPAVGRLKGLAEIRGVVAGLERQVPS
ncbi:MAG: mannonate dehydratase [Paracoccaceae bacterium]